MSIEIERKFLVVGDAWKNHVSGQFQLKQGYLQSAPERTVRIRTSNKEGFITIKGKTEGITRTEYEYPIPFSEALSLLALCENTPIEKVRYLVSHGSLTWEVDVFEGLNSGLVLAEVELQHENQEIDLPDWIGAEVSSDPRFYNSTLSAHPFSTWKGTHRKFT
jgi:CYTH domain-containing protein